MSVVRSSASVRPRALRALALVLAAALASACSDAQVKVDCANSISAGALFAGARTPSTAPGVWDCSVADGLATTDAVDAWSNS